MNTTEAPVLSAGARTQAHAAHARDRRSFAFTLCLLGAACSTAPGEPEVFASDCSPVGSIAVGTTVAGTLGPGDCVPQAAAGRPPTGFADSWTLSVATELKLRIDLVSEDLDEVLRVQVADAAPDWLPFSESDAGHVAGNARVDVLLWAGEWEVTATTYDPQSAGNYELTVELEPPCTPGTDLMLGETATGTLESDDCAPYFFVGSPADSFGVILADTRTVSFQLQSAAFQPYVVVQDGGGMDVAFAGDETQQGNATIKIELAAAKYALYATGDPLDGGYGGYTLAVEEAVCEEPKLISVGETVTGSLDASDCMRSGGERRDVWRLVIDAATSVRIDLTSGQFDTWLILRDEEGTVLGESGDGVRSRIDGALAAGTYEIVASSLSPSVSGPYELTVAGP